MTPNFHLLVLCFTLLQLGHTATAAAVNLYPVYTYCPNLTFAGPVPYAFQLALQTLLSDLSTAASSGASFARANSATSFSSTTAGSSTSSSSSLYGILLCRGDVNSDACASCVNSAAAELYSSCARSTQEAMIWYNLCMIRYSNTPFAGGFDNSTGNAFRRIQTVDGNLTAFNSVLGSVASTVENEAAAGRGEKFATGEGKVNDSLTVYVIGQCIPDLSEMDCRNCLGECISILPSYCNNRVGGLVLYGSCNLRYDTYPFYYNSSADQPNEPLDSSFYDVEKLIEGVFPKGEVQSEQLLIDSGVLVTTILLFGVFVLGSLRRRVYGSSPSGCILVFHSLIANLIPFLLGLMRSASHPHKSFTIWACYLLFAYGGFDTMTARNLSDNDNSTSYFLSTFSLLFGIVYVAFEANKNIGTETSVINLVLYIILVCLSAWNVIDTMGAFRIASKSKGLPEASKQTEHHMRHVFINNNAIIAKEEEATDDDAVSMRGYPYLVLGTDQPSVVTTTQVWKCLDKLFKSAPADRKKANNKAGERLKDICLSRALFNILLMRCAGYTLLENSRDKCMRFVEDGFLSNKSKRIVEDGLPSNKSKRIVVVEDGLPSYKSKRIVEDEFPSNKSKRIVEDRSLSIEDLQKMQKRVFTIIEWELEFLFDFFYTKFYYHSTKRYAFKFRRLGIFAIFMWFAIYELRRPTREQVMGPSIIRFYGHSVEVGIARIAIFLIAIVEAVQLSMLVFSNWTIVKLICLYARKLDTENAFLIKVAILFFSFVKYYLPAGIDKCRPSSCMFKPWKRKLGQYSLLENYDKVSMLNRLLLRYAPRVAQKESHAVTLSLEVKQAVVSLLAHHGFTLSCGKVSLARNEILTNQLSSFCSTEPEGDAYVILVWHIATSICEHHFSSKLEASSKQKDDEDFIVATQLSKYCAYLVIFAPELLSGLPYKTHTMVLHTIECVRQKLKGTKDIEGLCSKLDPAKHELSDMDTQEETLFGRVTVVVNHLKDVFDRDPKRGWKVLAEFWVELIIYLAPTENAIAHAEHLAKGGEFITLLWALLTNAGITSRD